MRILFSPSENKNLGGKIDSPLSKALELIYRDYLDFVKLASHEELVRLWGYKRIDEIEETKIRVFSQETLPAIKRYGGVAYEALDFESLDQVEQTFILDSVLIFSNLFGAVSAGEPLPFYKLKQGESFANFKTQNLYRHLKEMLDKSLEGKCVVDLRAEFYRKLYIPKEHCFTFEFLKNGKKISHYAKHYRGIVLREIAKNQGLYKIEDRLEALGLDLLECREGVKETRYIFAL